MTSDNSEIAKNPVKLQYAMMFDGGSEVTDIGRRVEHLRAWLEFKSQTAFAHATGLTPSEINLYESGRRRLPLNAANKIRLRWNVTLDWLYHGDRSGLSVQINRSLPPLSADGEKQA